MYNILTVKICQTLYPLILPFSLIRQSASFSDKRIEYITSESFLHHFLYQFRRSGKEALCPPSVCEGR